MSPTTSLYAAPCSPPPAPPSITAKPERSAEGGSVKARQYLPSRQERRKERERVRRFRDATSFADEMDWPLNIALTITWTALLLTGEHQEGHCLGRGEWEREEYTRKELARLCRSKKLPFAALWGRDVGNDMGMHVHFAMFWPTRKLEQLVDLIERITGSSAEFVLKPYEADVVARSVCGGWQINMNTCTDSKASRLRWAEYIARQHGKHAVQPKIDGKAFGISTAIGKAAQKRNKQESARQVGPTSLR